ncbi:MAG: UDP-3-O-(3-hydroxymyristoyl)glucosamine N-acyltransferase [Acidobacteriia bacterium]|nr:UDP-3-O-(3-hydroxymyristoyl)glucosamine N-acyltransferase [Terriglobia bacterium]
MKLSEIARKLACRMHAENDIEILGVAGIEDAGPGHLTFVANRKYVRHIKDTKASAIILGLDQPVVPIPSLRTANPYLAFARALELFHTPIVPGPGIHPSAIIAGDVKIGPDASIGAQVVIGSGCKLGARAILHPHVVLYPEVCIGDDVILHAGVVVREQCLIGHRVIIQNGSILGCDGFGFAPVGDGTYYKIRQTGRVVIEDDVEIGANTTIDRAAVGETRIGRGAKLDNLVQIGHGSQVGENSVLAAQVGLAGSTKLGRNVQAGGQAGFAGHQEVGDGAVITAQSGVHGEIKAGSVLSGSPGFDNSVWRRCVTAFPRLPDLQRRVQSLEKELELLKAQIIQKNGK